MTYVDGFLAAIPNQNRDAYIAYAAKAAPVFKSYGALSVVECWGDDVPDGKLTSFPMAVKKKDGETVVFSWIEWPDKETADACMASMQTDAEWTEAFGDMPFDGQRMIFGGFDVIVGGLG